MLHRVFLLGSTYAIVLILLSSCAGKSTQEILLGPSYNKFKKTSNKYTPNSQKLFSGTSDKLDKRQSRHFPGSGKFTKEVSKVSAKKTFNGKDGVTLNLVRVSVEHAAKVILADTLKINYTIDPQVNGQITIQTTNAVSKEALLKTFETILQSKGYGIEEEGEFYKIAPASNANRKVRRLTTRKDRDRRARVGVGTVITPLQYVSATEMARILKPIAPEGSILSIDKTRNLLILSGTSNELDTLQDAINVFDVDFMKGMSISLVPTKNSDPEDLVQELDTIYANDKKGPVQGVLRFIPNKRLNAVLIISSQPNHIYKAEKWIKRLDLAGRNTSEQLYVYKIQNRPASELTEILQKIFLGKAETTETSSGTGDVSPQYTASRISNGSRENGDNENNSPEPQQRTSRSSSSSSTNTNGKKAPLRIVTDEANNSLLIMSTPHYYKRILRVLERIDVLPNQVLLEATIAEVSLNDELQFGVKWFFQKGKSNFTFTDAASGAVASAFPGFSYFFSTPKIDIALDALNSITNVKVISSPSVMVLDNKKAVLQVGDQVPIATQSAVSVVDQNAPIVNSVSFKDTGVILAVKPRVNDSGRVLLEIEQEVSDVVQTTSSGIDSPTIQQRKIQTTVVVNDGESLTLGGLIQDNNNKNRSQVPLAGDIPILGNLFKQKSDRIERTELIIIITPRVVRDPYQADQVTNEFRRRLNLSVRPKPGGTPDFRENIKRTFR